MLSSMFGRINDPLREIASLLQMLDLTADVAAINASITMAPSGAKPVKPTQLLRIMIAGAPFNGSIKTFISTTSLPNTTKTLVASYNRMYFYGTVAYAGSVARALTITYNAAGIPTHKEYYSNVSAGLVTNNGIEHHPKLFDSIVNADAPKPDNISLDGYLLLVS